MSYQEVRKIADQYLTKVRSSGTTNILAVCPFHKKPNGRPETTPSFALSLTNGLWICHSCKETGTLPGFLRRMGASRLELDTRYKYVIEGLRQQLPEEFDDLRPEGVFDDNPLPEAFLGFFDECPIALEQAGFKDEILQEFDVGFDKKHMRITFPLRDLEGKLVGISGRTVTDQNPRYKVYEREYLEWELPERSTKKSNILWNAHRVYPSVYFDNNQHVVVVEGFKACMWMVQAGVKNTVALTGSYMSKQQRWMLERMGATVYLMFDNDAAGLAGLRSSASTLAKSRAVKIVQYRTDQPDGLSPEEIADALANAKDYYLWAVEEGKKKNVIW